ncbi:MAG: (2Fe-2S)-binding protein, partial [Actinomycetota bacterium]
MGERIELSVNGRAVAVEVEAEETLLDVLRDHLGLLAAKDGCQPEGYCGCCTVLVDGRARVACSQPASRFAGKDVVTLEGLGDHEREAFAIAFAATGASQCGFCSPGIVMKAHNLLQKDPAPSRDAVARALAGNLCRCTGYVKVIDAVQMAGRVLSGEEQPHLDWSGRIGSRTPKFESFEMALGLKPFIN